jgi:IS5 family transposase
MDAPLVFKTLVLSALYNLSDDQIEYQVRDRLYFMRFLGFPSSTVTGRFLGFGSVRC